MGRKSKRQIWNEHIAYGVTKKTPEVIAKFEQAFAIGATIQEACDYADVNPVSYYRWVKKYPELSKKFERLRHRLPLKAKENIARSIHGEIVKGDISLSKWLVERKQPDDYAETLRIKGEGDTTNPDGSHPEDEALRLEYKEKLKQNLQRRARDKEEKKP